MESLPLFHRVAGRPVLLVGDGEAADAKARLIESAGGVVTRDEAAGARLAFVALDDAAAAGVVADRLRASGLLVNVVDRPALCDFTVPAIVDREPVTVAIGTGGASATLAKALRERLEALLPAGLGALALAIRAAREATRVRWSSAVERRRGLDAMLASGGPLDPFAARDDASAAVAAALATTAPAPSRDLVVIALRSADPDDLTLRELRWLSQADTLFHAGGAPAAVLDRARRDAARVVADSPPSSLPPGRSVFITAAN